MQPMPQNKQEELKISVNNLLFGLLDLMSSKLSNLS